MSTNRKGSTSEKRPQKVKSPENNASCRACGEKVTAEQKGIECEICKSWFHAQCEDLEDEEYEVLSRHKRASIHWYCSLCNEGSAELVRLVKNLQDRLQKTETNLELSGKETKGKVMQLENRFSKLSVDTDREMCNLKSQIDSELRNLNNAVKDLQSEFELEDDKHHKLNIATIYRSPNSTIENDMKIIEYIDILSAKMVINL